MLTRFLTILTCTLLATALSAQTSGRHFHRDARTPATPPAAKAVEASAKSTAAPLQKLRSGRPWPRFHFGRLPQPLPAASATAVDATAKKTQAPRGFWRKRA
ncbi:MAG: hypothetical protein JNK15_10200 [Planctomycetes bacterium]|nr:hypothetical protein [Planctomycetota bacterium]